jgi:hypothetical protein
LESLPREIGNLMALKTLSLEYCSSLESLPREIGNLMALETLNLECCYSLESLPREIGNLKALRIFGRREELRNKDTPPKLTHPHGQERQELHGMPSKIPLGSFMPRSGSKSQPKFTKLSESDKRWENPLQKLGVEQAKSITEVTMPSSKQDSTDAASSAASSDLPPKSATFSGLDFPSSS